jgi:hypothetical protein
MPQRRSSKGIDIKGKIGRCFFFIEAKLFRYENFAENSVFVAGPPPCSKKIWEHKSEKALRRALKSGSLFRKISSKEIRRDQRAWMKGNKGQEGMGRPR